VEVWGWKRDVGGVQDSPSDVVAEIFSYISGAGLGT
jgi:hypothetical protein